MRTGVGVSSVKWQKTCSDGIEKTPIAKAIKRVMVGQEATVFRNRTKVYNMGRKAIEETRSSYSGLTTLLQDISTYSSTSD